MRCLKSVRLFCVLGVAILSLAGCPLGGGDPDGGTDGDADGSGSLHDLFAYLDESGTTYYDVAVPVVPELAEEITEEQREQAKIGEMLDSLASFQEFLASPVDDSTIPDVEAFLAARGVPPSDCYPMGPDTYVCIYQWDEGDGVYTLVDTKSPDVWTINIYFKGVYAGVTYPGDLDDPDDFGYMIQYHIYENDATAAVVQFMMEPGICDQCDTLPWAQWSFEVENHGTIATPWGEDDLITYTYTDTIYSCWPEEINPVYRYHPGIGTELTREPNGDVTIDNYTYEMSEHVYYRSAEWFIDHRDNSISWVFYDYEKNVIGSGEVP
jgi:hypothetical protein